MEHLANIFRNAYLVNSRKGRKLHPFQLRDGEAAIYLITKLSEIFGYRYKDCFLNYPSPGPGPIPVDVSAMRAHDLLIQATRPPMHDHVMPDRRAIPRSYTSLEFALFNGPLAQHFQCCARSEVVLQPETANFSDEIRKRRTQQFLQNGSANIVSRGSYETGFVYNKDGEAVSAAFLVYAEHAWPGGPAFLAAFGMGGTETLVWCRALATRFSHLLCTTSFAMAELRAPRRTKRPTSTTILDAWEVTLLGQAPALTPTPPPNPPSTPTPTGSDPKRGSSTSPRTESGRELIFAP